MSHNKGLIKSEISKMQEQMDSKKDLSQDKRKILSFLEFMTTLELIFQRWFNCFHAGKCESGFFFGRVVKIITLNLPSYPFLSVWFSSVQFSSVQSLSRARLFATP